MSSTIPIKSNTKSELLDRSRELFARYGYEGVSMRDIAGSVGIRQSAIYNHFESKQDLLVTLMVAHMEDLLDGMHRAIDHIEDAADRLEGFTRFHLDYHILQPENVFLAYMELRSLEDPGRSRVLPLRDAYESCLRRTLKMGQSEGTFKIGDAAVTARAILAMLTGITVWFRPDGRLDQHAVVESYVQATLQSVGLDYPRR